MLIQKSLFYAVYIHIMSHLYNIILIKGTFAHFNYREVVFNISRPGPIIHT